MNFIWDIALRAKESGIKEEELFFEQAEDYSPYYEQSFSVINQDVVRKKRIEINALYRFCDIFRDLLKEEVDDFEEFQRYLFDCAIHVLLYTDLKHGISKRELYIRKFMEEIAGGNFGEEVARNFNCIKSHQQNRMTTLVFAQQQTGSSLVLFRKAVLVLYPNAMLYQVKAEKQKLLLYVDDRKTERKERALRFVLEMFLPLSYQVRVFWKYHFGVIGVDKTMKINEIEIY